MNVSKIAARIVGDFVKQQKIVEQNVPLGFESEINATNIQITISKQQNKYNTQWSLVIYLSKIYE